MNLEDDYDTPLATSSIAEDSRPRHQYKEDARGKCKLIGRKQIHDFKTSKRVNWQSPFLWSQIEDAARRAGRPWSPRTITEQAKKANPKSFKTLTEQVVGWWIDPEGKRLGISRWKESVLEMVKKGNSPGGDSTRTGILVNILPFSLPFFLTCLRSGTISSSP
jgi:hypothetical protein